MKRETTTRDNEGTELGERNNEKGEGRREGD